MESVKENKGKRQIKKALMCPRGFTLTELIIVLGVMSMVSMVTATWLSSQLPSWRLKGAVRQVVSDLLAAKTRAVVERNRQRVIFQDDRRYMLLDDDNNNGKSDPGENMENRDIQESYPDVMMTASNNPSFMPRGTASNLASITLSNSAGKRIITVSITGRIKVKH
jgi:prepilin-type N-terminal cleavage/methylation domain-containing protein